MISSRLQPVVIVTGGSGFIGRDLCRKLSKKNYRVINIDIVQPQFKFENCDWIQCDIMELEKLKKIFQKNNPEFVFHLAAKADVFGKELKDYDVNITGTKHVIDACKISPTIKRIIVASSQLVVKPNYTPKNDIDFAPLDPLYSLSKVKTEEITRQASLQCSWTIVRPTNIWGPYHPRFPSQLWKYLKRRWYLHPSQDVIRSYGYVENVNHQLIKLIELEEKLIKHKVFYLGDKPIPSLNWLNNFSKELSGKNVRTININLLYLLALFGSAIKLIGLPFPFYIDRYKSMTTDYIVSMEKTENTLGPSKISLKEGVRRTISWLNEAEK